jgi:hypothetical protein
MAEEDAPAGSTPYKPMPHRPQSTLENPNQIDPVVNLVGWKFLEPPTGGVREEER